MRYRPRRALENRPRSRLAALSITFASVLALIGAGVGATAVAAWPGTTAGGSSVTASSSGLQLMVSNSSDRSRAAKLHGANLNGRVAIFAIPPSRVRSVAFYLDNPGSVTRPRHIEYYWPYDLRGTAPGGKAKLLDTSRLSAGRHLVTAKAQMKDGAQLVVRAYFFKREPLPTPTATAPPATIAPGPVIQPTSSSQPSTSTTRPTDPIEGESSTATTHPPTVAPTTSTSSPSTATPSSGKCSAAANTPGGPDGQGGCFPGPDNTGVPAGTNLTPYTGPCTITAANTVIDSKVVNCALEIRTTGVIIRRSQIHGHVQNAERSSYSFRIEDSFVDGSPKGPVEDRAIGVDNFVVVRTEVVGGNGGIYCRLKCTVQDSWVHGTDLDPNSEWHASAIRVEQYSTLVHNTLACDWTLITNSEIGCSADMTGYPDFAPITHNTMDGNLYIANPVGLGFCAYGGGTSGKPYSSSAANATYIVFRDNVFQRGSNGKCGTYGAVTSFVSGRTGNVWQNNRWSDGGSAAPG